MIESESLRKPKNSEYNKTIEKRNMTPEKN